MPDPTSDALRDRVAAALQHQYDILDEIGRGGMSVVYRARDRRLGRDVAVKVLPPELAHDPAVGSRFTREAQTSAQLSHAHIVPIFDVGEREGIAYFVMSLVTGGSVGKRLEHQPLRAVDEVRRLLCETADALAYAHLRGVIHRDIKADNILIDGASGRALVTDFGIARAIESGTRLTQTGVAVGTPTYMSPEQAMGERQIDGRSDIYSLGVLGYQMITGRVPFTASNSMALLLKHVSEKPQPIAELRPEAPRQLCDAIERALRKAPEERWATASEFRDALMGTEEHAPSWRVESREPLRYNSPVPRSRREPSPVPKSKLVRGGATAPAPTPSPVIGEFELEPPHLASLTTEQRQDLRLWFGRVNLLDRVKSFRRFTLATIVAWVLGPICFGVGVVVPIAMTRLWWRRGKSLRAQGLRIRRVLLARRSRAALLGASAPTSRALRKLAPRPVLESPRGVVIRKAAEERAAILGIVASLSKADRAMLPDVIPTVNALVERVAKMATRMNELDASYDPDAITMLDARIADSESSPDNTDALRQLTLLRRQRVSVQHAARERTALARRLDNAGLALANLRLDLGKLKSSGLESMLSDVTSATQEARALSRDIGSALDAVAEVRAI